MKSFAHFAGKIIIVTGLLFGSQAWASDAEYLPAYETVPRRPNVPWQNIAWASAGALFGTIAIAQINHSEVVFAGLYGAGALVYAKETRGTQFEDYIIPATLASMGLLNLTLLQSDEESKSTIVAFNLAGLALIGFYWYHFEQYQLQFGFTDKSVHLAFEF